MAKSSMAQVVAVSRQVNELDTKGKLIIMRDLQSQELEKNARERPVSVTIETGRIEKISATSADYNYTVELEKGKELRDPEAQGVVGKVNAGREKVLEELLVAAGGKVVDVTYEEGKEK